MSQVSDQGSGRGLVVRVLDSRVYDPHTDTRHGSLLNPMHFNLPQFASVYLAANEYLPTSLGRYLQWTSALSRRGSTTAL